MSALVMAGLAHAAVPADGPSGRCGPSNHHADAACPAAAPRLVALPLDAPAAPHAGTAAPVADDAHAELEQAPMSWKERLAVVAASGGALLFLLMRQLAAQRPGPAPGAAGARRARPPAPRREAAADVATPSGYMLSQFDSLQAAAPAWGDVQPAAPSAVRRVKVHAASRSPRPRRRRITRART